MLQTSKYWGISTVLVFQLDHAKQDAMNEVGYSNRNTSFNMSRCVHELLCYSKQTNKKYIIYYSISKLSGTDLKCNPLYKRKNTIQS